MHSYLDTTNTGTDNLRNHITDNLSIHWEWCNVGQKGDFMKKNSVNSEPYGHNRIVIASKQ